ncbi:hypothetical protein [Enterococcus hulanensis]|uniref:hypothetical protein n=1 Tax=Enterococcus hulanensis TaxID=2559929 RepID=UPI0010F6F0EE|nr:hypothetical protein [Enterococcus hulanensis]
MNINWCVPISSVITKELSGISREGLEYRFREVTSSNISLISMLTLIFVLAGFDMTLQNIDLSTRADQLNIQHSVIRDTEGYQKSTDKEKNEYLNGITNYYEKVLGSDVKNTPSLLERVSNYNSTLASFVVVLYLYLFFLKKARLKAIYNEIENYIDKDS